MAHIDLQSSAWAVTLAALTIIAKTISDVYIAYAQRRSDRRTLAAALAGELGAYLDNLRPEATAPLYRKIAKLDRDSRCRRLAAMSGCVAWIACEGCLM